jgi:hypothetical protein
MPVGGPRRYLKVPVEAAGMLNGLMNSKRPQSSCLLKINKQ